MNTKKFLAHFFVLLIPISGVTLPAMAEETAAVEELGNNLSFPVIAVDGFSITPLIQNSFTVPYTGTFPGLTDEEKAELGGYTWYPQKTLGNVWQAEFSNMGAVDVTYIDWGDNIESVNPKLRRPFRLEVTLYQKLVSPMATFTMAVLENPSSSDELQGTNTIQVYDNPYATVVSTRPRLRIQYLGNTSKPEVLNWDGAQWVTGSGTVPTIIPVTFGPELNVAGKYVFGASQGGWTPDNIGWYRLTFYLSSQDGQSGVDLRGATIANYSDEFTGTSEGTAAVPVIDAINNLSYVDVKVTKGGGEGRGGRK